MPSYLRGLRRRLRQHLAQWRLRQDPLLACDECCRRVAIARVRYFNLVGDSSSA